MAEETVLEQEDKDVVDSIKKKLLDLNIDFDALPEREQKAFVKVGTEIERRHKRKKELLKLLRENSININSIAKSKVISNRTIYNYPRIAKYIKDSGEEDLNDDNKDISEIKEELENTKRLLAQFDEKVLDVSLAEMELRTANRKLADYEAKINAMQVVIEKLENQNRKMVQADNQANNVYNKESFFN